MYGLSWPADREHIAFELREKELNNGVNLFDALMNAPGSIKTPFLPTVRRLPGDSCPRLFR